MKKNNIVVLGGGTAGWLTALFMNNIFPEKNITVIQSKEVGIIGVGEATTPHLVEFLRNLNIRVTDVIEYTKGSIKNGISFVNWNGDGKKYFHGFSEGLVPKWSIPNINLNSNCNSHFRKLLIKNKLPIDDYSYQALISSKNRIDIENTSWAIHFDAKLLAEYLEKIGRQRGVNVVEDNFHNAIMDENGFITRIELEVSKPIDCDLIFDCSGFSRILIGKYLKQKWISYADHLPMKCAIPFWLEGEDEIEPYTTATAMKYGWMWKIPLQHRIGSGYIFDSDYINEDQALCEAEEFYGKSLKVNKVIKFDVGRIENFWVKNCIAVGLSGSFIEPLESTSLYVTCGQLNFIKHFINELDNPRESSLKSFNKVMNNTQEHILNFVYFHYITKRQDSPFWKEFRQKNTIPKGFEETLQNIIEANFREYNFNGNHAVAGFDIMSFLQVGSGLEVFENDININGYENLQPSPEEYKSIIYKAMQTSSRNHAMMLRSIHPND
jgi:tryptophan halogenase